MDSLELIIKGSIAVTSLYVWVVTSISLGSKYIGLRNSPEFSDQDELDILLSERTHYFGLQDKDITAKFAPMEKQILPGVGEQVNITDDNTFA